MNISSLKAQLSGNSAASPAASKASTQDAKKIEDSAKQFEAMMVRQIIGEAFKPSTTAKGQSMPGSDIYQSFMTDTVADNISKGGSLGISHLLQSQLTPAKALPHAASHKPVV